MLMLIPTVIRLSIMDVTGLLQACQGERSNKVCMPRRACVQTSHGTCHPAASRQGRRNIHYYGWALGGAGMLISQEIKEWLLSECGSLRTLWPILLHCSGLSPSTWSPHQHTASQGRHTNARVTCDHSSRFLQYSMWTVSTIPISRGKIGKPTAF